MPVVDLVVPEGLWLMNKAAASAVRALQQIECVVVGADHGPVFDAGYLLGPGLE